MAEYAEIEYLKQYFRRNFISIEKDKNTNSSHFTPVKLKIDSKVWEILVDDEYDDFNAKNQLMCLFLVFSSLEMYAESSDYFDWCKQNGLNSSDREWLEYYKELEIVYQEIENRIGKIDSCISPYDYSLRTGVAKRLASMKFPWKI